MALTKEQDGPVVLSLILTPEQAEWARNQPVGLEKRISETIDARMALEQEYTMGPIKVELELKDDEWKRLEQSARKQGCPVKDVVRRIVQTKLRREDPSVPPYNYTGDRPMTTEMTWLQRIENWCDDVERQVREFAAEWASVLPTLQNRLTGVIGRVDKLDMALGDPSALMRRIQALERAQAVPDDLVPRLGRLCEELRSELGSNVALARTLTRPAASIAGARAEAYQYCLQRLEAVLGTKVGG